METSKTAVVSQCELAVSVSREGSTGDALIILQNAERLAFAISDIAVFRASFDRINAARQAILSHSVKVATALADAHDDGPTRSCDRKRLVGLPNARGSKRARAADASEEEEEEECALETRDYYPVNGSDGNCELHQACFEGDLPRVLRLIASGESAVVKNERGETPLDFACKSALRARFVSAFLVPDEPSHEGMSETSAIGMLRRSTRSMAEEATKKLMTAMCLLSWLRQNSAKSGLRIAVEINPEAGTHESGDEGFVEMTTMLLQASLGHLHLDELDTVEDWNLRELAMRAEGVIERVMAKPDSADSISKNVMDASENFVDRVFKVMWEKMLDIKRSRRSD